VYLKNCFIYICKKRFQQKQKGTRRQRYGLLPEHPYSITGLAKVRTSSSNVSQSSGSLHDTNLIRLCSPWAGGKYGGIWGGAWCERSWEWNALSERDRELLGTRVQDGEFWMSVQDFLSRFVIIWLCHIGPEDFFFEQSLHTRSPWRAAQVNGKN
jgi:Calpain family cysteine protease